MPANNSGGIRSFFEPTSVAVAGASTDPNKLGSIILANLLTNVENGSLKASVYALNPGHDRIGTRRCYATIRSLPETPELLIVAVPVSLTLGLVKEAAEAGVKAVIMVTSGFAETGKLELETEIRRLTTKHGMRILGPNTIGLLDTLSGMNSLFLRSTKTLADGSEVVSILKPLKGDVAILTQSGHLGEIISETLAANGIGIRALVGTGNQLDVSIEDVIRYFADDEHTKVMVVYLEGVHDGRKFMRAAAYAARRKPLIVLKVGKTGAGARAALTHTASLVGDYQVYQAAFRQSGVIEASGLEELVDYCVSFSMLPITAGRRLVIISNAGGVGAIAADEAHRSGLDVKPLSIDLQRRLRSEFPSAGFISNAALGNPMDLTASVTTDEFLKVTSFALALPDYDLALLLPTHQAPAIDYDVSARLSKVVSKAHKPVCTCVMGSSELAVRIQGDYMARGIPSFPTPERAVRALSILPAYNDLRAKARAPVKLGKKAFRAFGRLRGPVPPAQVSRLLQRYGIGEPKSAVIGSLRDIKALTGIDFPVACKLLSKGLLHKTGAGGVVLNVSATTELAASFIRFKKLAAERGFRFGGMLVQEMVKGGVEVILGETRDPTFGPTVLFGVGGTYTELVRDYSLAIAPVSYRDARDMIERSRLRGALDGYRGGPQVDLKALSRVVSRFSRIMAENPSIEQIEVNPLIATEDRILAVDARVVLSPAGNAYS